MLYQGVGFSDPAIVQHTAQKVVIREEKYQSVCQHRWISVSFTERVGEI